MTTEVGRISAVVPAVLWTNENNNKQRFPSSAVLSQCQTKTEPTVSYREWFSLAGLHKVTYADDRERERERSPVKSVLLYYEMHAQFVIGLNTRLFLPYAENFFYNFLLGFNLIFCITFTTNTFGVLSAPMVASPLKVNAAPFRNHMFCHFHTVTENQKQTAANARIQASPLYINTHISISTMTFCRVGAEWGECRIEFLFD